MKKTLFFAALGISAFAVSAAQAVEVAPYAGVKTGVSMLRNNPAGFAHQDKNVVFGSIAAGVDFHAYNPDAPYSLELEYTYRPEFKKAKTGASDVKIQNQSLMLNGYYEFIVQNPIKPYVSAGIGWSRNHREVRYLTGGEVSKSVYDLTWSLGAGIRLPDVSYNTDAVFGYRYLDFGRMKTGTGVDMSAHEIYAGLNYKF